MCIVACFLLSPVYNLQTLAPLKCFDIKQSHHKRTEHGSDVVTNDFARNCFILGNVHQLHIASSGGNVTLQPYGGERQDDDICAHLLAPEGVVAIGTSVAIDYAIILEGPFQFPGGYQRVSSVLFLSCSAIKVLQKAITVRLRHWATISSGQFKERNLCFMKADHLLGSKDTHHQFWPLEGGKFQMKDNISSGSIRLKEHFCLVCIAIKSVKNTMPGNTYYAILCEKPIQGGVQEFRICITYGVPSWIEVCYVRRCMNALYNIVIAI